MTKALEPADAATAVTAATAAGDSDARARRTRSVSLPRRSMARPCHTVAACVFELLDGELGPPLAAEIAAHLATCAACRQRVARDRALLDAVGRAARAECVAAPTSLRVRVRRALVRAELDGVSPLRHA